MQIGDETGLLIATRNRLEQLRTGLDSVLSHEYHQGGFVGSRFIGACRTLVIDDGSTDGTREYLDEKLKETHHDALDVHYTGRLGKWQTNPSAVMNKGHKLLGTDIVIEQGGEVVHVTNCVTPLAKLCKPGKMVLARVYDGGPAELEIVRGWVRDGKFAKQKHRFSLTHPPTSGDALRVKTDDGVRLFIGEERPLPFLFCGAIHKKDFDAVGGYDETLTKQNDQKLAERLVAHGVEFVFSNEAIAFHLRHPKA